jgi:hypothetical protein
MFPYKNIGYETKIMSRLSPNDSFFQLGENNDVSSSCQVSGFCLINWGIKIYQINCC